MLFAIDIDGTIAYDKQGKAFARYLNQTLSLGVPDTILHQLSSYHEFVELHSIQVYIDKSPDNKQRYRTAFQLAANDPAVQQSLVPVEGALAGVEALSLRGKIINVTCRKPESISLTQAWLARYGFPAPEQVYTCEHYHFKYVQADHQADPSEPIILIDDHAEEVIKFFHRLVKEDYGVAKAIRKRLAVIAFGTQQVPPHPFKVQLFPVLALPSWEQGSLEQLIGPVAV